MLTASLAWSPNGEWLAVVDEDPASENAVLLVSTQGGERRRLLSSPVSARFLANPVFSPNGLSLAYVACVGERACDVHVQDSTATRDRMAPRGA